MNKQLASFFLRTGLALVFLYAAVAAFLTPDNWIGYFPGWLRNTFPDQWLLYSHSFLEITLALWLFSNKRVFYAAAVSAGAMFLIVIFNIGLLDIVFRDVAIFFMALALAALHKEDK